MVENGGVVVRPLAGAGIIARHAELLLVCREDAATEDLLAVWDGVVASGGDGATLVRRVAALLAADVAGRGCDCAVSGPAGARAVAVLVHGAATAQVSTVDGVVTLSGLEAITSADRLVSDAVEVRLQLPGAAPAHPRARLDGGVVPGGGLVALLADAAPAAPAPASASGETSVPDSEQAAAGQAAEVGSADGEAEEEAVGTLRLDDGTAYPLDLGYLVGREPHTDPEVVAGSMRALRLADPEGLVSRKHVRVTRVGDLLQVTDLASANGTVIARPGESEQRLVAFEPADLPAGTTVIIGRRWLRYET